MPEFEQKDLLGIKAVIVHFASWEDVNKFSDLVGQKIGEKTKYIWYPENKRQNLKSLEYSVES